ncbi:MAG: DNA polymerase I [Planctomycetes bacterium]|nr:DNA polymerase I [Planctomycetota bacterium]
MTATRLPRLFLLDGTALAYRSHFAMARTGLSDAQGRPTGATFAFLSTILKLVDTEQPDHLAVAFDPPGPTFRHERFADYKATREKMPDELVEQLPRMRECVEALGIPILELPGYEADDAIGTMAKQAESAGYEVFLVTGDKDFMQLVSERVKLYNILKADKDLEIVGPAEVEAKFGVGPAQVIEVLSLMGDAADNVPGVFGVGEKTAQKLIQQYGTLEEVLAHAGEVKGAKLQEALRRDAEQARLSRELVTIALDVPLGIGPDELERKEPDGARMLELCRALQFNTLAKRFSAQPKRSEARWEIVRDASALRDLVEQLRSAQRFTFDTETTHLDPLRATLVGLSFSTQPYEAFYVPLNLEPPILPGGASAVLAELKPLLEDTALEKCGQNIKYDALALLGAGIELRGIAFDTMIASYCLEPESRSHGIDALALQYLQFKKIETSELIGKGKDQITMDLVPIDEVGRYACEDADIAERLHRLFEPALAEEGVEELFRTIEMPLVPVLIDLERAGIKIDSRALQVLGARMQQEASKLQTEVFDLAGGKSFNLNSPKQLGVVLFEELKIQETSGRTKLKKTKTGEYSTDARTLEEFADAPIVAKLLEYRTVTKLKSTYVDALPLLVHPKTGRIHTSFNQAVAATGRLSSSDPNLQNIPIRTERGREIRRTFIAEAGCVLLSADYSQIELRLVAHLAEDERLIAAFHSGADIHRQTAALIFGLAPEKVDADLRSRAKAINFGIIYGMGSQRLAQDTGISVPEARAFIDAYFATFPGVRRWLDSTLEQARRDGYVTTLYGRRRKIPDINSDKPGLRVQAENMAVNTPVQGSAADLIKKAMIEVHARMARERFAARMLLQVHDELVFEAPEDEVERLKELVRETMQNVAALRVPLLVEIGAGANWLDAH